MNLSVLIPVYNEKNTISEVVQKVLATGLVHEIVIVDDGSTDASGDIAARKAAADRRIRLIRQSNQGIVASMNRMLGLVETPFVARMDADDISLPDRFALQLAHFDRTPALAFQRPDGEIALSPDDARERGIADGDPVTVRSNGTSRSLRARIVRDLLPGVARVPHADADGLHGFVEVSR